MEQIDYNLLFRWFVGLSMDDGGGQAVDAAKYFAWRKTSRSSSNRRLFPSMRSLAIVPVRENSLVRYFGFVKPQAVYIDLDVLEAAPKHINRAGISDVFCFFTGVWDRQYAEAKGKCEPRWRYNDSLAKISLAKAEALLARQDDVRNLRPEGTRVMAEAGVTPRGYRSLLGWSHVDPNHPAAI